MSLKNCNNNYIKGTCLQMCPEKEIAMREKENLLHVFEIQQGTENDLKPKADKNRIVKSFARSAAGKEQHAEDLRPPDILLLTVNYLLTDILNQQKAPWHVIYDFIMDRLRSVRQDLIIQNSDIPHYIVILQPIIRFHAFAAYKLCEESMNIFDPYINETHLQECLKRLLVGYDEMENSHSYLFLNANRPQFEALYILLNLGDPVAITRGLCLNKFWRTNLVNLSLEISLSYYHNNYVRVCKLMRQLPALFMAVAYMHLRHLRRKAFQVMSVAYNSKNLTVPVENLKELFLYSTVQEVKDECKYYGFEVNNEGVKFNKSSFNQNKSTVKIQKSHYLDDKFASKKISTLILYGD